MNYTLPPLPYDYDALEPHISATIMKLHHDKHHQAYVDGANGALKALEEARSSGNYANINQIEKNLAFNLGGHSNHSVFWKNLSPNSSVEPKGDVAQYLKDNFASFDNFKAHFAATALGIQGSGWAILAYDTISTKPLVFQLFDQQGNIPVGVVPLLTLDMWEHAFYLDYQNVKANYVNAWWNVINWDDVNERLDAARSNYSGLIVR